MPITNGKMCVTKNNFRNKIETVETISFGGMSSAQSLHVTHNGNYTHISTER